ncbi:DNA ligase 1-like [Leptopilina heterotoma]|uniref:DNA ligase 1-like n=1 Tax=Leptopilina heterotoma TaxID=63436 RepID=UPI001CAA1976|nr:DNA ligase 1-like [Leptopilina heterotoma]
MGRPLGSKNTTNKSKDSTLEMFANNKEKVEFQKSMEKMLKSIGSEIKEDLKVQLKDQKEDLIKEWSERLEAREKEWRKEKENWKKEKEELFQRIRRLESDKEKKERENRKLNIVLKGVEFSEEKIEEKVEEFIEKSLNVKINVVNAYVVRKNKDDKKGKMVVAKLHSWDMKKQIMKKKKELQRGIYIDDDLTEKERSIQQEVRRRAREERDKGKNTKIGYMSVQIEGKWLRWNDWEECFIEEGSNRKTRE